MVLLNDAVQPLAIPASNSGQPWTIRASTFGAPAGVGTVQDFTVQANSLRPYSPVNLRAVAAPSGDVTFSWFRRTRIDGGLRDLIDVPLKEASELYEVKLYNGSTLLRTWRVSTPSVLYTTAQQTADFGTAQTSYSFSVVQISALTGPGNVAQATVTVQYS